MSHRALLPDIRGRQGPCGGMCANIFSSHILASTVTVKPNWNIEPRYCKVAELREELT